MIGVDFRTLVSDDLAVAFGGIDASGVAEVLCATSQGIGGGVPRHALRQGSSLEPGKTVLDSFSVALRVPSSSLSVGVPCSRAYLSRCPRAVCGAHAIAITAKP